MAYPVLHLPSSGLISPPPSPRKRRRLLRDSEESEGDMTLEQYMMASDPYRTTTLPDHWPYPLVFLDFPDLQENLRQQIDAIRMEIRAVLRAQGMPDTVPFMPYLVSKPGYPRGDKAQSLLRVYLDGSGPEYTHHQIGLTKDELQALFRRQGLHEIYIEIVNTSLCFHPSLFAIPSSHSTVLAYEKCKNQIVDLLFHHLQHNWTVVCPFLVGRNEAKANPAVVILIVPVTRANWSNLRISIMTKLMEHTGDPIDVEFLPGDLSFLQPVSFGSRMSATGTPEMGYSTGIRGDNNAGTMGGYLTLRDNGRSYNGFLTCYHVIRPKDNPHDSDPFLDQLDRMGGSPSRPLTKDIHMECVANMDQRETLADLQNQLVVVKAEASRIARQIEERELMGARPLPGLNVASTKAAESVKLLERNLAVIERMPFEMGHVLAASGLSVLGRRVIDWAFVELSGQSRGFFAPNLMFDVPENQQPLYYGHQRVIIAGSELTKFGSLKKDGYYVKRGRTTGITAGICNGALAFCNWSAKESVRYDHNGTQHVCSSGTTEEFIMVNKKTILVEPRDSTQAPFADHGDSGPFVIDEDMNVCGLLYAGVSGFCGPRENAAYVNAGLVTSMSDVQNSIRLRVSPFATISLPEHS